MSRSARPKPLKGQVEQVVALLESGEVDLPEDATPEQHAFAYASALIDLAWDLYEERMQWCVTAALYSQNGALVRGDKVERQEVVTIGGFASEGNALSAGDAMAIGRQAGELWKWYATPLYFDSAASFHKTRGKDRGELVEVSQNGTCGFLVASEDRNGVGVMKVCARQKGHPKEDGIYAAPGHWGGAWELYDEERITDG